MHSSSQQTLDTSSRCISLRLLTVSNRFIQSSKINRRYKRCTGFFARRVVFLVPVFHRLPFHYQILVPLSTPHAPCNYTVLSVQLHTQIPLIIGPVLIKNIGESGRSVWCAVPTTAFSRLSPGTASFSQSLVNCLLIKTRMM